MTQGCAFISMLNFNFITTFSQEYLIIIFYDKKKHGEKRKVSVRFLDRIYVNFVCSKISVPDPDPTSQKTRFRSDENLEKYPDQDPI